METEAMALVSVYKVEQDLQRTRREEKEQQDQSEVERILEQCRIKPMQFQWTAWTRMR